MKRALLLAVGTSLVLVALGYERARADGVKIFDKAGEDGKIYERVIMAGSAGGAPPDSPALRVDPNLTTSAWGGVGAVRADVVGGYYMGSGTAVSPRHIVTAAHVLDVDDDGTIDFVPGDVSFYVCYGGSPSQIITASALAVHPDWTGFLNPSINDDIAIITLSSDLPAGAPIYGLYTGPVIGGQGITPVGYGWSGYGDVGYSVAPSLTVKREGGNEADVFYLDDEGGGFVEVFEFDFDGPVGVGTSGGPTLGNTIETTLGGGDSGGPSFVWDGSQWLLYGVDTYSWRFSGQTPGTFGTGGGGTFVSRYAQWITGFLPPPDNGGPVPEPATLLLLGVGGAGMALWRRRRR